MTSKPMSLLCSLALCVLWQTPSKGNDDVDLAKLRALAQPLIDGDWANGLVIGVISDRGTQIVGLGHASKNDSNPPSGNTIFEIGSVTKVFTGLILAQMTIDETADFSNADPVQKVFGAALSIPKWGEHEINFTHLATHTSGLPRSPDNLVPKDPSNPFADYSVERLGQFLSHHKLGSEPGTRFEYSNLGAGLLGHALAMKSGLSYEALLRERILKPLGMADTFIALDKRPQAQRVQAYDADGQPVRDWDWDVLAGAGAVRSTAADLLKFVAANVTPDKTPFRSAIEISQAIQFKALEDEDAVGLAWRIRQHFTVEENAAVPAAQRFHIDGRVIWHGGDTFGYSAFVGFWPERRVGAVVLSNRNCFKLQLLGLRILDLLGSGKAEPLDVPTVAKVGTAALDKLVGTYRLGPSTPVTITRSGDHLLFQIAGQPALHCYPQSERSFFLRVVDARVQFQANDKGQISQLILDQDGEQKPATREN